MESQEFDSTLGGTEQLPFSANTFRFATSRSIEIAAMTESLSQSSGVRLIFQKLPVHMRRRVMSHNCKRLPRKLRVGHTEQFKKSGFPPKQKMPSRKYRRRPANLLAEYERRKKSNVWLETHIWHAKRFHMVKRWGHKLALAPCDKAFRACYRATSAHCLMHDMSYYVPISIQGSIENIGKLFSNITSKECGLSITAKAYTTGSREGQIHLFEPDQYPFRYIGQISFIWEQNDKNKLWLFVHPALIDQIKKVLLNCEDTTELPLKRMKLDDTTYPQIEVMPGAFNRFRLTGPRSHAILSNSLKCIDKKYNLETTKWIKETSYEYLKSDSSYWQTINNVSSPAQLPRNIILSIIVKDPRLSRPKKRTKAIPTTEDLNTLTLINLPTNISDSPIWNKNIHASLKENMLSNHQFIKHVSESQLVPGEVFEDDPAVQVVPVVLIQRPGSQDAVDKKIGYGCGWDIILPTGYALPFWQTFIMYGARAGGLREVESLAFEMGKMFLPIDSKAGQSEEIRKELDLRNNYFKRPASKRVNYVKLGVSSPFRCLWSVLLKDWCKMNVSKYFILRQRAMLNQIQECLNKKQRIPQKDNSDTCLVPIYIKLVKKGKLKNNSLIYLPKESDKITVDLMEPQHADPNEKIRKTYRVEHRKLLKQQRRRRIKDKKNDTYTQKKGKTVNQDTEYLQKMQELWLPSTIETLRHNNSRELMGFMTQGAFSFSEAKSCAVGLIAYNALKELSILKKNFVIVRNNCSRKYRAAHLRIIKE